MLVGTYKEEWNLHGAINRQGYVVIKRQTAGHGVWKLGERLGFGL